MKRLTIGIALLAFCAMVHAAAPTATVTWGAPTANTDGSAITGAITYTVYMGGAGVSPLTTIAQSATPSTKTVISTGLVAGTTVCFAVKATVAAIDSAQTAPVCLALAATTLTPSPPSKVTVTP